MEGERTEVTDYQRALWFETRVSQLQDERAELRAEIERLRRRLGEDGEE